MMAVETVTRVPTKEMVDGTRAKRAPKYLRLMNLLKKDRNNCGSLWAVVVVVVVAAALETVVVRVYHEVL
jgi:hypothetical protein